MNNKTVAQKFVKETENQCELIDKSITSLETIDTELIPQWIPKITAHRADLEEILKELEELKTTKS